MDIVMLFPPRSDNGQSIGDMILVLKAIGILMMLKGILYLFE